MPNNPGSLITFGSFRLTPEARTLRHADSDIPLAPKTFDLLLLFARNSGRVVTKKELMDSLWKDVFVEEGSLLYQVSTLRKALGEEGAGWVETVPRVGYRFSAPVEYSGGPNHPVATQLSPLQPNSRAADGRDLRCSPRPGRCCCSCWWERCSPIVEPQR